MTTTFKTTHNLHIIYKTNIPTDEIADALLYIKKPDKTLLTVELTAINETDLMYAATSEDLNLVGTYKLQAKITTKDNFVGFTGIGYMRVNEILE